MTLLAWLAGRKLDLGEDELRGPVRRAVLLLAAGGDPHRALEPDGRAVTALADDLDRPERRSKLLSELALLRAETTGLAMTEATLDALLADPDLAWRAFAAGLLGDELAGE